MQYISILEPGLDPGSQVPYLMPLDIGLETLLLKQGRRNSKLETYCKCQYKPMMFNFRKR